MQGTKGENCRCLQLFGNCIVKLYFRPKFYVLFSQGKPIQSFVLNHNCTSIQQVYPFASQKFGSFPLIVLTRTRINNSNPVC